MIDLGDRVKESDGSLCHGEALASNKRIRVEGERMRTIGRDIVVVTRCDMTVTISIASHLSVNSFAFPRN